MPARLTSYPASAVARQPPLPLGPCRRMVAYPVLAPRRRYGAPLPVRLVDGAVGHAVPYGRAGALPEVVSSPPAVVGRSRSSPRP